MMDDFQLYQKALSDTEIKSIMSGLSNKSLAVNVSPADGATDVPRDATLNWTAGQYPATHDVYFGTVFADVNSASRTSAEGCAGQPGPGRHHLRSGRLARLWADLLLADR